MAIESYFFIDNILQTYCSRCCFNNIVMVVTTCMNQKDLSQFKEIIDKSEYLFKDAITNNLVYYWSVINIRYIPVTSLISILSLWSPHNVLCI